MKRSISEIIKRLKIEYPDARCHLVFKSPFELMISTILAAQCTDDRINLVMIPLYKNKYHNCEDILKDGKENFRNNVKSINFFNNKTNAIFKICEDIIKKYNGKIPDSIDDLTELKGIGRKSANVILGNCFNKKDVIIVDTHFKRVTARLGLTENDDPQKIEMDLKIIIHPDEQFKFSLLIGEHGRQICKAKSPKCGECILNGLCPSFKIYQN
jgi:endonuclease-3